MAQKGRRGNPVMTTRKKKKETRPRGTNWEPGGDQVLKDDDPNRYRTVSEGAYGYGEQPETD